MAMTNRSVPVEYAPEIRSIQPEQAFDDVAIELTLLELIQAVNEVSDTEQELLAAVVFMLRSGRIRLTGSFRECGIEDLCS